MVTDLSPESVEGHPPSATASAGSRRGGVTAVALFLVLLVAYLMVQIQLVVVLTLLSLIFATIVERPVQELERRHLPRPLGILAVYAAIIAGVALLSWLITPVIVHQTQTFKREAPGQLQELETSWQASRNPLLNGPGQQFLDKAIAAIDEPPVPKGAAMDVLTRVVGGIVGLLSVLVIAFYYLMEKALLRRLVLLEVSPGARPRVQRVWDDVEAKVGDWLRGQIILCLIIGVGATIGYGILGVRFWPLLGLWAGVTELIPIVGPWLGGIPAAIIAMTQSFEKALVVIGFVAGLQLLENIILVPRVMRGAVGLTPLTVFLAILAGTEFMGPIGALLAIPVAAAIQVIVTDYLDSRREAKRAANLPLPGWRWMRGHLHPGVPSPTPVDPSEVDIGRGESGASVEPPPPPAAPQSWSNLFARAAAQTPENITLALPESSPPSQIRTAEITPAPATPPEPPSSLPAIPTKGGARS